MKRHALALLLLVTACATASADDKPATPAPLGSPIPIFGGPPAPLLWIVQPMTDGSQRVQRAPRYAEMPCAAWQAELDRLQRTNGQPYTGIIDSYWLQDACSRPAAAKASKE